MKLGFALQLVTVRWLGTFLEDPLDVPGVVLEFVAEQLGVEDPSQVKRYTKRRPTPFDHQQEIRKACQWKDFASVEPDFVAWVAARSWTSGDGPKAIFSDGVGWLRERKVLLPGVTTLARLVAKVRDDTTKRLWGVLGGLLTIGQRYVLDQLLEAPPGSRVSDLERWRKGFAPRASGPTIIRALDQVSEILGLELAELGAEALVPQRRLGELARYGMRADASALRRHPDGRRRATLLATVRHLEGKSIDDTLELLDLLMATELLNKAQTAANKEKVRKHLKLARASARLAVAVEALFESDGWGGPDEEVRVAEVWEAIETVISRADLRAALVLVNENVPPADVTDSDDWRTELVGRYATVSGFLKDALDPIWLKVFEEKTSGKLATDDRPALLNALGHIRDGDMLTVQEVDRLGRNLLEGLIVLNDLFQRGVGVKVLEGIAAGEHTERSLILDLALALAEDRRHDITRKTKNGLEAARRRGRVGGRRPAVDDDKRAAILARRQRGESIRTIAAGVKVSVGVVHKTLAGAKDA